MIPLSGGDLGLAVSQCNGYSSQLLREKILSCYYFKSITEGCVIHLLAEGKDSRKWTKLSLLAADI